MARPPDPRSTLRAIAKSVRAPDTDSNQQGVVEIVGPDLDASIEFYESIGFDIERRTGPFAVMNGFGLRIFIAENPMAPVQKRWANLRIVVEDVDVVHDCINALGLTTIHPISDRPYGLRDFVIADPSGFEIRFAQVLDRPSPSKP